MGTATVALALNGLGLSNRQLYLAPQFFADKPVERLLGPGILAEDLNHMIQTLRLEKVHRLVLQTAGTRLRKRLFDLPGT